MGEAKKARDVSDDVFLWATIESSKRDMK